MAYSSAKRMLLASRDFMPLDGSIQEAGETRADRGPPKSRP